MEQNNDYPGKQWQPIFDYMVDNFDTSLTLSEMEALINGVSKVIGYADLQAKCERYEKALNEIAAPNLYTPDTWEDTANKMIRTANEALSGEGGKEVSCEEIALDKLACEVLTDNQFELEYQGLSVNDKRRYLDKHANQKEDKHYNDVADELII